METYVQKSIRHCLDITMDTSCCASISTIFRTSRTLQGFYTRKTENCFNGSGNSSPRDCADAPITGGSIWAMSPGASAGCRTGPR